MFGSSKTAVPTGGEASDAPSKTDVPIQNAEPSKTATEQPTAEILDSNFQTPGVKAETNAMNTCASVSGHEANSHLPKPGDEDNYDVSQAEEGTSLMPSTVAVTDPNESDETLLTNDKLIARALLLCASWLFDSHAPESYMLLKQRRNAFLNYFILKGQGAEDTSLFHFFGILSKSILRGFSNEKEQHKAWFNFAHQFLEKGDSFISGDRLYSLSEYRGILHRAASDGAVDPEMEKNMEKNLHDDFFRLVCCLLLPSDKVDGTDKALIECAILLRKGNGVEAINPVLLKQQHNTFLSYFSLQSRVGDDKLLRYVGLLCKSADQRVADLEVVKEQHEALFSYVAELFDMGMNLPLNGMDRVIYYAKEVLEVAKNNLREQNEELTTAADNESG